MKNYTNADFYILFQLGTHFLLSLFFAGRCKNGTEAVGCGPQEEFRACADVTITQPDGSADNTINQLGNCKQA